MVEPPQAGADLPRGRLDRQGLAPAGAQDRRRAARLYAALVSQADEGDAAFWQGALRGQVYLGDAAFVERMQAQAAPRRMAEKEIPKAQRHVPRPWPARLALCGNDRDRALYLAYREDGATMTGLAQQAGLSVSHVSRLISGQEQAARSAKD